MDKNTTSWNDAADWYKNHLFGEGQTYHRTVILPNLLRLLAIKEGEDVLDLACGPGFFSREFVSAGARVVGVDLSEELIKSARQALAEDSATALAEFFVASADDLRVVGDRRFDAAVIVTALQNIDHASEVLRECAHVLKPGGRLFIVLNHPCFRVPRASSWGWDRDIQYRRVDAYLSEAKIKIQTHPGSDPGATTVTFHRPLQYYFKALAKFGFCLSVCEEWTSDRNSDSGPRASLENRARKEIPLFLCLGAVNRGA